MHFSYMYITKNQIYFSQASHEKKNSLKCLAVGLMMTIGLNERISLKRSFCFKRGIFSVSGEVAHRRTCTQTFGYKSYPVMTSPGELVVVRYKFSKS